MDSSVASFTLSGVTIRPGETREIYLKVSESFLSSSVLIPVTVIRGTKKGPTAFVMAAIHGDEINGADIVRKLIFDIDHDKLSGTLIAIPVVNIPGFLGQTRYVPYHRDLNRYFPGKKTGNNAERMAHRLFSEIVSKCDFGIDLHTASSGRSNLPHVRGDMSVPAVRKLARAFGANVLVNQPGVKGSLRREATRAGVPTIVFEAGEAGRFSKRVSSSGLRGVLNVMAEMGMWGEEAGSRPDFQVIVRDSEWIRAPKGGIIDLDIRPGELIYKDDPIGTILNPFGRTVTELRAPCTGIIIGITTQPITVPGTGIAHVARLKKTLSLVERALRRTKRKRKPRRVRKNERVRS